MSGGYQHYDRGSFGDTGTGLDSTGEYGSGYDDLGGGNIDVYGSRGSSADYGPATYGSFPHDMGGSASAGYDQLSGLDSGVSQLDLGDLGFHYRDDYGAAGAGLGSTGYHEGLSRAPPGSFGGGAYDSDALGSHARFDDFGSDSLRGRSMLVGSSHLPGAFGQDELSGSLNSYGHLGDTLHPYLEQSGLDSFEQRGGLSREHDDQARGDYQGGLSPSGSLGMSSLGFDDQYPIRGGGGDLYPKSYDDRGLGERGSSLDVGRSRDGDFGFDQRSISGDPLASSYTLVGSGSLKDQHGHTAFGADLGARDGHVGSAPLASSYLGNDPYRKPWLGNDGSIHGRAYTHGPSLNSGLLANEQALHAGIIPDGIGAFDYKENAAGFANPFQTGYYQPATSFGDYAIGAHEDELAGQYGDLLAYQETLDANADLSAQQRLERWNARAEFETLSEPDRESRWNDMNILERERLGLLGGYHGAKFGGPEYYLRSVNTGFGNHHPNGSYYPLLGSLQNRYGSYLEPSYLDRADYLDSKFLYANDLATFSQQLRFDESLAEKERMRLWQERQQFELLSEADQMRRWREMDERRRMQLGLGSSGWAAYRFAEPSFWSNLIDPRRLRPRHYELSNRLRDQYSPYIHRDWITDYSQLPLSERENALSYYSLVQFDNELRRSRLSERERLLRWQQRLAFQELNEAHRRAAWWRMQDAERAALGLGMGSLFGERYRRMGMRV